MSILLCRVQFFGVKRLTGLRVNRKFLHPDYVVQQKLVIAKLTRIVRFIKMILVRKGYGLNPE